MDLSENTVRNTDDRNEKREKNGTEVKKAVQRLERK